jgi:hypothetical protein
MQTAFPVIFACTGMVISSSMSWSITRHCDVHHNLYNWQFAVDMTAAAAAPNMMPKNCWQISALRLDYRPGAAKRQTVSNVLISRSLA